MQNGQSGFLFKFKGAGQKCQANKQKPQTRSQNAMWITGTVTGKFPSVSE